MCSATPFKKREENMVQDTLNVIATNETIQQITVLIQAVMIFIGYLIGKKVKR
jgi:hypothetical protein